jgi:RNA polymerase sigma-70 factor (ECF subfamily)
MDSIQEIAAYYGMSQAKVKSMLHRTRIALKNYLEQEGFEI